MYKVLLVSGDSYITDHFSELIDWKSHDFEIAGIVKNGLEAAQFLKRADGIDIVVIDVALPEVENLKTIEYVKSTDSKILYIVLSVVRNFSYPKEEVRAGADDCLLKSPDLRDFISALESCKKKLYTGDMADVKKQKIRAIVRNNLLFRWVTGRLDANEFYCWSSELGIDPASGYYQIAFIHFLKKEALNAADLFPKGTALPAYEAENICASILDAVLCASAFPDLDHNILVVFYKEYDRVKISKILFSCVNQCHAGEGAGFFISVGEPVSESGKIAASFASARKLQKYQPYQKEKRILFYDQITDSFHQEFFSRESFRKFWRYMFLRDKNGAIQCVHDTYEEMRRLGIFTQRMAFVSALKFTESIFGTLVSMNCSILPGLFPYLRPFFTENDVPVNYEELVCRLVEKSIEIAINGKGKYSPVINRVIGYLNETTNFNVTVKTLAEKFNMNADYLGKLFKKEVGKNFSSYLNDIRMNRAKNMIAENRKATEISAELGFCNSNYFYRIFKKTFGVSPKDFMSG